MGAGSLEGGLPGGGHGVTVPHSTGSAVQIPLAAQNNVFDLRSGEIFLFPFPDQDAQVTFNLFDELKKGGHYYDMPRIQEQLEQPLRPLLPNMKR